MTELEAARRGNDAATPAPPALDAPVRAARVETEDDSLYYEVRGQGPPLLMIAGAPGDAGVYSQVAPLLADDFQVITFDRRGNSRSTGHHPQNFEIGQQARDAVAVVHAAGHARAHVFGSSGGALIALEMARSQAAALMGVIAHEPPALRALPDAAAWQTTYAELNLAAWTDGPHVAMQRFLALNEIQVGAPEGAAPSAEMMETAARGMANAEVFVRDEMLGFVRYMPDVAAIRRQGTPVILALGEETRARDLYFGRAAPILAAALGCELRMFPGHHVAYMDMPQPWSQALRAAVHRLQHSGSRSPSAAGWSSAS